MPKTAFLGPANLRDAKNSVFRASQLAACKKQRFSGQTNLRHAKN
jgi:hypothetical protein